MEERLTVSNALNQLEKDPLPSTTLFKHGSLEVKIYKPDKIDKQQPHSRDEVYVVSSGSGYFINDGKKQPVEKGEALFVAANVEHRFTDFTGDFSTWVFFYGPEGGE